jgi:uncharacterized protein with NRDE domain
VCTLIVAWLVFEEAPICVAANRDEASDRPSTPPAIREGNPRILAPRDERAGGTWLGYNDEGLLVAVTNRWVAGEGDRSRGLLVDDALEASSAAAALEHVETELTARDYAPFHLLLADGEDCLLVENDPNIEGDHAVHSLDPGVHVVVNVGFDGEWFVPPQRPDAGREQARNAERLRAVLQSRPGETAAEWTTRAGELLGDHEFGVCIHRNGFGTRSSSLIRLGEQPAFEFADGPPCETPYEALEDII